METSYPIEKITVNGEEYLNMESTVFHDFFNATSSSMKIDYDTVQLLNKEYDKARKIKRKRIRFKKEKQVLSRMYDTLFGDLL